MVARRAAHRVRQRRVAGFPLIFILDIAGGPARPLTTSGADVLPEYSPDGSKIAFVSGRDGNGEIYLMNADGSGVKNLTNDPGFSRLLAIR